MYNFLYIYHSRRCLGFIKNINRYFELTLISVPRAVYSLSFNLFIILWYRLRKMFRELNSGSRATQMYVRRKHQVKRLFSPRLLDLRRLLNFHFLKKVFCRMVTVSHKSFLKMEKFITHSGNFQFSGIDLFSFLCRELEGSFRSCSMKNIKRYILCTLFTIACTFGKDSHDAYS